MVKYSNLADLFRPSHPFTISTNICTFRILSFLDLLRIKKLSAQFLVPLQRTVTYIYRCICLHTQNKAELVYFLHCIHTNVWPCSKDFFCEATFSPFHWHGLDLTCKFIHTTEPTKHPNRYFCHTVIVLARSAHYFKKSCGALKQVIKS